MKQTSSQIVTEEILNKKFKDYPTRTEIDQKFQEQDENAREYRDQILNKLDEVMAELENNRIDRDLAVSQTRELEIRVGDHEKGLTN